VKNNMQTAVGWWSSSRPVRRPQDAPGWPTAPGASAPWAGQTPWAASMPGAHRHGPLPGDPGSRTAGLLRRPAPGIALTPMAAAWCWGWTGRLSWGWPWRNC
jgi:hypothetical protein